MLRVAALTGFSGGSSFASSVGDNVLVLAMAVMRVLVFNIGTSVV